jgi:hypothetical protein
VAVGDADVVAEPYLVGLAAPNEHSQTAVVDGEIADIERDKLAAA